MAGTDYEDLSYRGQVARMRALAWDALRRFGVRSDRLVLMGHGENTVFGVPGARGMRYALRIHRLDYQSPTNVRSELAWLAALGRDTDIPVQAPKAGRNGQVVQQVAHEGVPGERSVVLLRWMDGPCVGMKRGVAYQRAIGRLAGTLHRHVEGWKRPSGFTRMRWDETNLLVRSCWGDPLDVPGLRRTDRELFTSVRRACVARLRALGKARSRFGLIHADLHGGNVLRTRDGIAPIDFDDCGFGWYLYDLTIAGVLPWWRTPRREPMIDALLEGYAEQHTFDPRDAEFFHDFVMARSLLICGWLASRSDNPGLRAHLPAAVKRTRKDARAYLRAGR